MRKPKDIIEPVIRLLVVIGVFATAIMLLSRAKAPATVQGTPAAIPLVGDIQVVEIIARGGYRPRSQTARANTPAVLKVQTNGTYDCSAALKIPAIGYQVYLPPTGITSIDIPAQKPGTTIFGICSMGMYSFKIRFD